MIAHAGRTAQIASAVLVLGVLSPGCTFAQTPAGLALASSAGLAATKSSVDAASAGASAPKRVHPMQNKPLTQPEWTSLSEAQRAAVKPLFADWATMPSNQKRKWIELTAGFASMSAAEQAKVHSRMSSWTALSPQQRSQARINFAEAASSLNASERRDKWQAYQQLSSEEKQRLRAVRKTEQPKGAAPAPRTAASDRLAAVPKVSASNRQSVELAPGKQTPKIIVSAQPSARSTGSSSQ